MVNGSKYQHDSALNDSYTVQTYSADHSANVRVRDRDLRLQNIDSNG